MLSFKQFMELQHSPLPMEDASKFYEDYKNEYERKHLEIFFNEHKTDLWFTEKYDPNIAERWQEERKHSAKVSHKLFIETARSGGFNGLRLTDQHVENISGPPYFGFDPNALTLFLKTIPVHVSRWDLITAVKSSPGFVSLSMSEPLKSQDFCRFAWVLYDSEDHCNESLALLTGKVVTSDFRLIPVRSQSATKKEPRTQLPHSAENIALDWRQSARLIRVLDLEKGITENSLMVSEDQFTEMTSLQKEFQVDLQLLYMRRVHSYCFYCLEEYDDERMLSAKCGPSHIRSRLDPEAPREGSFDERLELRLQSKVQVKGYDQGVSAKQQDIELQRMLADFESKQIVEEVDDKVRCNLCRKLFRGVDFVRKHIHNKHPEDVEEIVKKVRRRQRLDVVMFDNYTADLDKLTNSLTLAGDAFRSTERRGARILNRAPRRLCDEPYEDFDDPNHHANARKMVVYDDI
jgi:hypothetical protein